MGASTGIDPKAEGRVDQFQQSHNQSLLNPVLNWVKFWIMSCKLVDVRDAGQTCYSPRA